MAEVRRINVELWDNTRFFIFSNLEDPQFSKILNDWIFYNKDEDFSCKNLLNYIHSLNLAGIDAYADLRLFPTRNNSKKRSASCSLNIDEVELPDLGMIY